MPPKILSSLPRPLCIVVLAENDECLAAVSIYLFEILLRPKLTTDGVLDDLLDNNTIK